MPPVTLLILTVLVLAVMRATRVVTEDRITLGIRKRIEERWPGSLGSYFAWCPWCVSVWVGAAAATAAWHGGLAELLPLTWWVGIPAVALAASHLTGLASRLDDGD